MYTAATKLRLNFFFSNASCGVKFLWVKKLWRDEPIVAAGGLEKWVDLSVSHQRSWKNTAFYGFYVPCKTQLGVPSALRKIHHLSRKGSSIFSAVIVVVGVRLFDKLSCNGSCLNWVSKMYYFGWKILGDWAKRTLLEAGLYMFEQQLLCSCRRVATAPSLWLQYTA